MAPFLFSVGEGGCDGAFDLAGGGENSEFKIKNYELRIMNYELKMSRGRSMARGWSRGCALSDREGVQVDGEGDGFFVGKGEKNFVEKSSRYLV